MRCKLSLSLSLALTLVIFAGQTGFAQSASATAYGKLPLSFEANAGEFGSGVKFLAHASGYTLFLTSSEAVISMGDAKYPATLRMQFGGHHRETRIEASDKVAGVSNYFLGSDRSRWRTNVPHFARVSYRELYPGIDGVYYGDQQQLEFDWVVSPGADPHNIKLSYSGAKAIQRDVQGNLVFATAAGTLTQLRPLAYQEVEGRRREVAADYLLTGNQVTLRLGAYDHSRALIVDPAIRYSTYLGGTGRDFGHAIAVDVRGSVYISGATFSSDFPVSAGAFQNAKLDFAPAFVTKLSADGSSLVYSTYLGGTNGNEDGRSIAVDLAGNAYIGGLTMSNNFPTTAGAFQRSTPKFFGSSGFVTKLSADGGKLVYSTYLAGHGYSDEVQGIAIDAQGDAFVSGSTNSGDFPTENAFQSTYAGSGDAFAAKLNPAGSALVYSTFLGGTSSDIGNGIAIDAEGNAYVTGVTTSLDFPTQHAYQPALAGAGIPVTGDAFVSKLDRNGNALVYSTYLGGATGYDVGEKIAVDGLGEAYVAGYSESSDFPLKNAVQRRYGGNTDAFVSKFSASGSALVYSTYLGGSSNDYGYGLSLDVLGDAYISGGTNSPDFPVASAIQRKNAGGEDVFVTALTANGSSLYSTYLGGVVDDESDAITVDFLGNAYVTGWSRSVDYPTTHGAYQKTSKSPGSEDVFVTKISLGP
jgi:hypothetical protein